MTYYLAGPMSGYPEYNYQEFSDVAAILRNAGFTVASPHEVKYDEPAGIGSLPYEDYIQGGLNLLRSCQGLLLMAGWPQSTGCRGELRLAMELDMPVYYLMPAIGPALEVISMNRRPMP
jgi:hypothetical protein